MTPYYCRAAEQLVGLPKTAQSEIHAAQPHATPAEGTAADAGGAAASPGNGDRHSDANELEVADEVVLGKTFFDVREYRRAAHVLKGCTSGKGFFLRCHALYLVRQENYGQA